MVPRVLTALAILAAAGCTSPPEPQDSAERWVGAAEVEVTSIYGETGCTSKVGPASLEHLGLPAGLREVEEGETRVYLSTQPIDPPGSIGASRTGLRVNDWELWVWLPAHRGDGVYHYILVQDDAATDPILYERASATECSGRRSHS
jgi:hypothetical protein